MIGYQIQKESQKRQRSLMRQITTRRMKISALTAELEKLQQQLAEVTDEVVAEWVAAGYDFDDFGVDLDFDDDDDDDLDDEEVM